MDFREILNIGVPLQYVLYFFGSLFPFGWGLFKYGKSTQRELVAIANQKEGHERQRAVAFSEDLATAKQTIANREVKILELERYVTKANADLRLLASTRVTDADLQQHVQLVEELKQRVSKLDELRSALLGSETELWRLRGRVPTPGQADGLRQSRTKVLVVANLKGGVGKTTITANLAAYFAVKRGVRVLVVDFDYQGSLTGTLLTAAKNTLGSNILADALLGGEVSGRWVVDVPRDLGAVLPNTRLVTCGQIFDRFENQTTLRWLIGEIADDIRYRLAQLVLTPEVQSAYDIVIIDAPPRTSLGAINAHAASHAMIVPTVLDSLSVDAVGRFLRRTSEQRALSPGLGMIWVVPSMTQGTKLDKDELSARTEAQLALSSWSGPAYITENFIRHFPSVARTAGREVGYLRDTRYVRPAFDALGDEISSRIGL